MNKSLKKGVISATKTATLGIGAVLIAEKIVKIKAEDRFSAFDIENRKIFVSNLGEMSYSVKGTGDPIVLLHDFYIGASHKEWHMVIEELQKKYTVYDVDFVGFGYSSRPKQCWTAYQYALLIEKFLKYVIKTPATIIGSNSGGDIGLILSNTSCNLIRNLICISPKGFKEAFPDDEQVKSMKKQLMPVGKSVNFMLHTNRKSILNNLENKFSNPIKITDEFLENTYTFAQIGENSSVCVAGINSNFNSCPTVKFLENAKINLCIIWGEDNQENNIKYMDLAKDIVKKCEYIVFEGVGNFPHIENPDKFIGIVNNFLK